MINKFQCKEISIVVQQVISHPRSLSRGTAMIWIVYMLHMHLLAQWPASSLERCLVYFQGAPSNFPRHCSLGHVTLYWLSVFDHSCNQAKWDDRVLGQVTMMELYCWQSFDVISTHGLLCQNQQMKCLKIQHMIKFQYIYPVGTHFLQEDAGSLLKQSQLRGWNLKTCSLYLIIHCNIIRNLLLWGNL